MKRHLITGLMVLALTEGLALLSPVQAYETAAVSNGGSITGKAVFQGTSVPTRTVLPTKNKDVCGEMRTEPLVEIGKDNGVKNTVVILKGITKGKAWGEPTGPYQINNEKCVFQPHVQVVPVGADFTIRNSDPFLHNTHSFHDKKTVFNVALPFSGAEVKKKLDTPGIVRIECDVHGWMQGWVYVADNPYYALTGEDGTFTISDVPPGDYTLLIWQEHSGSMEKQVSVKAGAAADIGTIEIK